jgi:hypothetical protein
MTPEEEQKIIEETILMLKAQEEAKEIKKEVGQLPDNNQSILNKIFDAEPVTLTKKYDYVTK